MKNKNQNKIYKEVLKTYDIEKVEINNYDLKAKLKDKIKTNKNQNSSDKDNKMAKKSKIDMVLEIVLEVRDRVIDLENRVSNLENRMTSLENDIKQLKSEAIKHGWEIKFQ